MRLTFPSIPLPNKPKEKPDRILFNFIDLFWHTLIPMFSIYMAIMISPYYLIFAILAIILRIRDE